MELQEAGVVSSERGWYSTRVYLNSPSRARQACVPRLGKADGHDGHSELCCMCSHCCHPYQCYLHKRPHCVGIPTVSAAGHSSGGVLSTTAHTDPAHSCSWLHSMQYQKPQNVPPLRPVSLCKQ